MSKRRYPKRRLKNLRSDRNYDDPAYKKWRRDVFKRDGYKCQWAGCVCKRSLNAHHIRTWAKYPALRFNLMNGITLCYKHHGMVWGKEEQYEVLFTRYLVNKIQEKRDITKSRIHRTVNFPIEITEEIKVLKEDG